MSKKTLSKSEHDTKYQKFLEALKKARQEAGLTQVQVAEFLGRSQDWVSRCETGEHRVDLVELTAFIEIYGEEISTFLDVVKKQ